MATNYLNLSSTRQALTKFVGLFGIFDTFSNCGSCDNMLQHPKPVKSTASLIATGCLGYTSWFMQCPFSEVVHRPEPELWPRPLYTGRTVQ
jgi:hypothetical protein